MGVLSDYDHPAVQAKAGVLTRDKHPLLEKTERLFTLVREGIQFGFPAKWDVAKASETL